MSQAPVQKINTAYFGKIPSRGDFVKNSTHPQLMSSLDHWAARAVEQLGKNPHWKTLYDQITPFRFAFLGSRSKLAIAGYLQPSRDHSGRRFPFLCATSLPVNHSLEFIARSPMAFSRLWATMEQRTKALLQAESPDEALQAIDQLADEVQTEADDGFHAFMDLQTLDGLTQLLQQHGHSINIHDMLLALGSLLTPLLSSTINHTDRGLLLPLPSDPLYLNLTAAFWLNLIASFLSKNDFELAVFIGDFNHQQRLAIGLRGAHPEDLAALISTPELLNKHFISIDTPSWVHNTPSHHAGIAKLSSYLQQPQLSLRTATTTFHEVFTGA